MVAHGFRRNVGKMSVSPDDPARQTEIGDFPAMYLSAVCTKSPTRR